MQTKHQQSRTGTVQRAAQSGTLAQNGVHVVAVNKETRVGRGWPGTGNKEILVHATDYGVQYDQYYNNTAQV